jgi:ABC-type antimicrobial peptide transport system permease subunit
VTGSNDLSRSVAFAIRSERTGTESLLGELREAVWSVNASLPLARVQMLGEVYDHSMVRTSFTLVMLAIAASMALALGVVGLYGVISYVLSQRHREVGIRLALGAQPAELKRMFVRHGLALAGVGIALGLVVAAALTRFMSPLLYGVGTLDPMTYLAVPFVLAAAAALASYLPARRAARVDPLVALRYE